MASKQLMAVLGALAFLGTFAVLAATLAAIAVVKFVGEERLSRWTAASSNWIFSGWGLARKLAFVGLVLLAACGIVLLTASATSHEWSLAPGEEKYFCEIDCHLAYSVAGVQQMKAIAGANPQSARGTFYVVNVRTRFDEQTISSHRGNGPLTPSPREVKLVDNQGGEYAISRRSAIDAGRFSRQPLDAHDGATSPGRVLHDAARFRRPRGCLRHEAADYISNRTVMARSRPDRRRRQRPPQKSLSALGRLGSAVARS